MLDMYMWQYIHTHRPSFMCQGHVVGPSQHRREGKLAQSKQSVTWDSWGLSMHTEECFTKCILWKGFLCLGFVYNCCTAYFPRTTSNLTLRHPNIPPNNSAESEETLAMTTINSAVLDISEASMQSQHSIRLIHQSLDVQNQLQAEFWSHIAPLTKPRES